MSFFIFKEIASFVKHHRFVTILHMESSAIIRLKKNRWKTLPNKHFFHSTNGEEASQESLVKLKYDDDFLHVNFRCLQNPFVAENTYTQHNDELYNQEVFEVFITPQLADIQHYLEFEINPNNAIWIGKIFNETGFAPTKADMILPENSGIVHQVKVGKEEWSGEFRLPFQLIGEASKEYALNFYRIISKKSHQEKHWIGTPADCEYTCWRSTLSGENPAFHRPARFGRLILD